MFLKLPKEIAMMIQMREFTMGQGLTLVHFSAQR